MKPLLQSVVFGFLLCIAALQGQAAAGDEDEPSAERAAESLEAAVAEVKKFGFSFVDDRSNRFTLIESPLFRYTNPLRGEVYSAVFVWIKGGRPEVIATVNNWYSPRPYLGLAATSLSPEKLCGTRDGQDVWLPRTAGVEFRAAPTVDPPAATVAQRLRQMSALAREFTAEFKREARYNEGGTLRLLSRPIYRYGEAGDEVLDGALFAFAEGTAPQLILLIEARRTLDSHRWEYALAPLNSAEYRVWHSGQEVWSLPQLAPPWPNSKDPTNTYTVFPDLTNEGRSQELAEQLKQALTMPR